MSIMSYTAVGSINLQKRTRVRISIVSSLRMQGVMDNFQRPSDTCAISCAIEPGRVRSEHMLHLRLATINDLDLLRRWDDEPQVVESDPNDDCGWETELLRSPPWRE